MIFKVSVDKRLLEKRQKRLEESIQDVNHLVRQLKADDVEASYEALGQLVRNSKGYLDAATQLNMSKEDFNEMVSQLRQAKTTKDKTMVSSHMGATRELAGVTKGTPDPSLGKPASLSQAQVFGKQTQTPKKPSGAIKASPILGKIEVAAIEQSIGYVLNAYKDKVSAFVQFKRNNLNRVDLSNLFIGVVSDAFISGDDLNLSEMTKKELQTLDAFLEEVETNPKLNGELGVHVMILENNVRDVLDQYKEDFNINY